MNESTTGSKKPGHRVRRTPSGGATTLLAYGEPMLWLTGGMLATCLLMIVGLLALIIFQGLNTFWPRTVHELTGRNEDRWIGEVDQVQSYRIDASENSDPTEGTRRRYRTGNFELLGSHYTWIDDADVVSVQQPSWSLTVEQYAGGRVYGILKAFRKDGEETTADPVEAWKQFQNTLSSVRELREKRNRLERSSVGPINRALAEVRREWKEASILHGSDSAQAKTAAERLEAEQEIAEGKLAELRAAISKIDESAQADELVLETTTDPELIVKLNNIVRAYPANQLEWADKIAIYGQRWWEFVSTDPREANSEGGVLPAIIGTLVMTMLMSVAVVPFGVVAALYLKEYAKAGLAVSMVRIAINNLAGVPSIVFGVFGLGFFVYVVGGSIDRAFYWSYDGPVFGQGGVLWASLTLALLTLPVVIVATEESLSAVPNSMREGSYACGASKWQTIWHIVLPRAMPGVLTGLILAIARGAGEVAPLMLVGVLEHAPELPVDGTFPFLHPDRPFMHLGFSIFHSAFKSQNSEAARPLVFTTTLLLFAMIGVLNVFAVWWRGRLRRKFATGAF